MAWPTLLVAGLFEVGWAIGLKSTHDFTRLWPTVATVGHRRVKSWVDFKPIAHPTSKSPATSNVGHAISSAPQPPRFVTSAVPHDGAIIAESPEAYVRQT